MKNLLLFVFLLISAPALAQNATTVENSFYVSQTGTDAANNCTASAAPCATITHAVNEAMSYNAGGAIQTIHLSAGTWNENVFVTGQPPGAGTANDDEQLLIDGDGQANTYWFGVAGQCGTLTANKGANVGVENLSIGNTSSPCGSALYANLGGEIQVFGGMTFQQVNSFHMYAEDAGSEIMIWNSYAIQGGDWTAQGDLGAFTNSMIEIATPGTHIVDNTPENYTSGFYTAGDNGTVFLDGVMTYADVPDIGGVSCKVYMNGVVDTGGTGVANIPGKLGPNVSTGGQCQ